jgi:hypothetical protein
MNDGKIVDDFVEIEGSVTAASSILGVLEVRCDG